MMVSYAKYQSAKNRKNNICIMRTKENWPSVKNRSLRGQLKIPAKGSLCEVNLSNVMDPFFGKLSICSWLQVSIECSHVWNRSLPKWKEICFDVQKRLRSYFEMLSRGCVFVNRFILWYGLVHCWNGYLAMWLHEEEINIPK